MELRDLFRNLVKMAAIDKKFAPEEISFLVERAEGWGIQEGELENALAEVAEGNVSLVIPEAPADREHLIKEFIRLMAVDGELADTEKQFCAFASAKMELTSEQFSEIVDDLTR